MLDRRRFGRKVTKEHKFEPRRDELLRRAQDAMRRSQELIAKAKELQRQSDQFKNEKYRPQTG